MNDADRHARLSEMFAKAIDLPPDERIDYLDSICGDDAALRAELDDLLARDGCDAIVDKPVIEDGLTQALYEGVAVGPATPTQIGPYEIIDVLGRGGMGVVYRAQQQNPNRMVALKVVQETSMSRTLARRIEYEAQILGRLQHEGIAQIYEAGAANLNGQTVPFFAMELVDGAPLGEYADREKLSTDQRVALLIRVCKAVQHAHQQGVIHRDLKPANVLVNFAGQPKVLDFGIARVTDADVRTTTLQTNVGQLVGTVAYMSPEQVSGDPTAIDTRSDVYGLGVVAFELLTNHLPHAVKGKPIAEAARIIRDENPTRLSTYNTTNRGDLETILAKALEKDKEQRYQSAAQFAADLQRYLDNEPIVARPPSVSYRFRKFTQRHRALVAALVAVFVLLVAAVLGTGYGLVQAQEQRDSAISANNELRIANDKTEKANDDLRVAKDDLEQQNKRLNIVNSFLGRMIRSANPQAEGEAGRREMTVIEMIDREAGSLEKYAAGDPSIEATLHTVIGNCYEGLGRFADAEKQLKRAWEIRSAEDPDEKDAYTTRAMREYAGVLVRLGRDEEAIPLFRHALEQQSKIDGAVDEDYAIAAGRLGWALLKQKNYKEAEKWTRASLAILKDAGADYESSYARCLNNLGQILRFTDRLEEAEATYQNARTITTRLLGERHATVAIIENNIAQMRQLRGDYVGAAEGFQAAANTARQALGDDHPTVATLQNNLGMAYYNAKEYGRSVTAIREAVRIERAALGENHPGFISTLYNLSYSLLDNKDFEEAATTFKTVADFRAEKYGAEDYRALVPQVRYAQAIAELGRAEEAEPIMRRSVDLLIEPRGADDMYTQAALRALVELLHEQNRDDEAEPFVEKLSRENEESAKLLDTIPTDSRE